MAVRCRSSKAPITGVQRFEWRHDRPRLSSPPRISTPERATATYLYPRPGQARASSQRWCSRATSRRGTSPSASALYVDDLDADMNALLVARSALSAPVCSHVMALLSWLISSDILGALRRLQSRMHDIANGALDARLRETDRGDEIGRMAETLEMLRQTSLTARSPRSRAGQTQADERSRESARR